LKDRFKKAKLARANFGIILAAGRGTRFGKLKQFVRVRAKPLLYYSLRAFELCPAVSEYVVVTNPEKISLVRRMVRDFRAQKVRMIVPGGPQRMDSVAAGLKVLPESGYVALHDAARPLIVPEMLSQGFQAVQKSRAVTFGGPLTDTVKELRGNRIIRTLERKNLVATQTPQFFELELLRRAYARLQKEQLLVTDECQAVEFIGIQPVVLINPRLNLKVTYPADLTLCEALL
jgi:2-C-methyl-D-erythritol 4-phosphate cytidylyltransferase